MMDCVDCALFICEKSLNYIFSSYKAIKSLHTSWDKPLNSYGLILQSLSELFEASKCFFFQILQRRHLSKQAALFLPLNSLEMNKDLF